MNINTTSQLQQDIGSASSDATTIPLLNPRQQRFKELYCSPDSPSFGNCYQSAITAGFSDLTARNLTHNRPQWYSDMLGQVKGMEPEHLVLKLGQIINSPLETTQNKLKAIDMLMKHFRMYENVSQINNFQLNMAAILD